MRLYKRRPKTQKIWQFKALFLVHGFNIEFKWFTKWSSTEQKPVLAYKEPWMQENGLNKFRTIVCKVSSFVGNPEHHSLHCYGLIGCIFDTLPFI